MKKKQCPCLGLVCSKQYTVFISETGDETDLHINTLLQEWELYEEPEKLHSFEEAIAALKEGLTVRRKIWAPNVYWKIIGDEIRVSINMIPGYLCRLSDNKKKPLSDKDILANDWMIREKEYK